MTAQHRLRVRSREGWSNDKPEVETLLSEPRTASFEEIPVLDLGLAASDEGLRDLAAQLRAAALGLGFFYVKNHGASLAEQLGAFDAARRYFALPLDERMRCPMDILTRRGFMPMFSAKVGENMPDLKESFDMGYDLPADDPAVLAGMFMHGPNLWPEGQPWLKEVMDVYIDRIMGTSRTLLHILALSLDVEEDFFLRHFNKPVMHTRLFHYPPQPESTSDMEFGVAPHTDHGLLTILDQDEVGGLEVMTRQGEWVGAPYIEGTLIVNFGNLLKRWTNDLYVSNWHRVINRSGRDRYSIPTFLNLDNDAPVACIPSCLKPGEEPLYPASTSGRIVEAGLRRDEAKLEREAAS